MQLETNTSGDNYVLNTSMYVYNNSSMVCFYQPLHRCSNYNIELIYRCTHGWNVPTEELPAVERQISFDSFALEGNNPRHGIGRDKRGWGHHQDWYNGHSDGFN